MAMLVVQGVPEQIYKLQKILDKIRNLVSTVHDKRLATLDSIPVLDIQNSGDRGLRVKASDILGHHKVYLLLLVPLKKPHV